MTRALLLLSLAGLVACGDSPPSVPVPPPAPPSATPGAPPAPPAGATPETASKSVLELTDKDFVEGANNRDPFRAFMGEFNKPVRQVSQRQRKVVLPRYGLDELRLIAVVTGGTRPRAMFRDPSGLGVTVSRGDYISKNEGKVKQILNDKVVVEIEEISDEKSTMVDRVIDLHPKETPEHEGAELSPPPPREPPEPKPAEKLPQARTPEKAPQK